MSCFAGLFGGVFWERSRQIPLSDSRPTTFIQSYYKRSRFNSRQVGFFSALFSAYFNNLTNFNMEQGKRESNLFISKSYVSFLMSQV
jgi:hypothetical protein